MVANELKIPIEQGDLEAIGSLIDGRRELADEEIRWGEGKKNASVPLQYTCDASFEGLLTKENETEIVALLLDRGAGIDRISSTMRDTPLIGAASLYLEDVGILLLDRGANLHHRGTFGGTPLHWASWTGSSKLVERLLQFDLDLEETCDDFASTPLYWAVHGYVQGSERNRRRQVEVVRMLLGKGADPDTRNKESQPALALVDPEREPELFRMLSEAGARL